VVVTPCRHKFCRTCITTWLESDGTCPTDRKPLTVDKLKDNEAVVSPFGPDAGLFGAAALALYPERR